MNYSYNNPYMNGLNGFGNNNAFGNMPQMQMPMQGMQYQMPPKTNKIFVTSLEEALAKPVEPHTEVIYLHQTEPLLFEVSTDMQGKKTVKTFALAIPKQEEKQPAVNAVTREEFEEFKKQVESMLKGENVNE